MSITNEQLAELTERINSRLDEFDVVSMPTLSKGVIRLVHEVIWEWLDDQPTPERVAPVEEYTLTDGYHFGYQRGREAMRRELLPRHQSGTGDEAEDKRLVTNSEPDYDPDPDGSIADAAYREAVEELVGKDAIDAFDNPNPLGYPPISEQAAATAAVAAHDANGGGNSPEHVVVTPLVPRRSAVPSPNEARDNVAAMVAAGGAAFDYTPRPRGDKPRGRPAGHNAPKALPAGKRGNVLPTRQEFVAEVRRQAMGGTVPPIKAFDAARPKTWATAWAHLQRLKMSWSEVVAEAGLKPNPLESVEA